MTPFLGQISNYSNTKMEAVGSSEKLVFSTKLHILKFLNILTHCHEKNQIIHQLLQNL